MKNSAPSAVEDISDSYEGYDPDVGIMSGGGYCDACELPVPEEDDPFEED